LFAKLQENTYLLSDAEMNTFYLQQQGSTLAELLPLEEAISSLFVIDTITGR
jgi:hypothetical protein